MKYTFFIILAIFALITPSFLKRIKHHHGKHLSNAMRFKSVNSYPRDEGSRHPPSDRRPSGFRGPPNAPDLPEEMPEELERELDSLKEQESAGVSFFSFSLNFRYHSTPPFPINFFIFRPSSWLVTSTTNPK